MPKNSKLRIGTDATDLLIQLRNGEISAEQLVTQHLAQLNNEHKTINAATHIFNAEAVELARNLDQHGDETLPLFGLPCSVKETFGIAGHSVTAGSVRMTPEEHSENSEIVRRLKAAGAVIIARSNIPEFAMTGETTNLRFGRCNNPLDPSRTAGGSSGGEGALVGSGAAVFGVGSDILGSIRLPAAFCGTVGFKPHSGAVNKQGTWPIVNGDTKPWLALGPLTRSVRDAQLVYNVVADTAVAETLALPRQLVEPKNLPLKTKDSCITDAVAAAKAALVAEGVVETARDFSAVKKLFPQIPTVIWSDFYAGWRDLLSSPSAGKFSLVKELIARLRGQPTVDGGLLAWIAGGAVKRSRSQSAIDNSVKNFANVRNQFREMIGDDGVMVTQTIGFVAPTHGDMNKASFRLGVNGLMTAHTIANYCDLPAIAIPAWKFCDPATGLPPSVSVVGTPGNEAKLFAAARIVEAAINPK
jgi:Asp-tRNA(Asn)/Glu-tRNA(Gln) amidotransferase A subunit family amidase